MRLQAQARKRVPFLTDPRPSIPLLPIDRIGAIPEASLSIPRLRTVRSPLLYATWTNPLADRVSLGTSSLTGEARTVPMEDLGTYRMEQSTPPSRHALVTKRTDGLNLAHVHDVQPSRFEVAWRRRTKSTSSVRTHATSEFGKRKQEESFTARNPCLFVKERLQDDCGGGCSKPPLSEVKEVIWRGKGRKILDPRPDGRCRHRGS